MTERGAVQRQDTQLALDQVSLTLWQTPSSKQPVVAQSSATFLGVVVVTGNVVVVANTKQFGTSWHSTFPFLQVQVLQSIGLPAGVKSLNISPDVNFFPPCIQ
jgi:hypothetical protein